VTRRELLEGVGRLAAVAVGVVAAVIAFALWLRGANELTLSEALAESLSVAAALFLLAGAGAWTRTGRYERTRDALGKRTLVERTPEERRRRERLCAGLFAAGGACFLLSLPFA
jgi:hypothetical protein